MKEPPKLPSKNLLKTPHNVKAAYADWFDTRIDEFVKKHKGQFEPASMFKHRNGFFITLSFNQNRNTIQISHDGPGNPNQKTELELFNDFYNRVCRDLIGRNYHRHSFNDQKPLAIACLDANGSRYWRSMGEIENPHIHSIWVFTNRTANRFRNLLADENWLSSNKERLGLRELDIQPLDHDRRNQQGPSRVSSYTAKFIAHNNDALMIADDFRVFPL